METIRQALFTNWHLMRWLRLGFGIIIAIQAIQNHDAVSGLIASFFLFQAFTNSGCCGAGGCEVPSVKKDIQANKEIEFEEVKQE